MYRLHRLGCLAPSATGSPWRVGTEAARARSARPTLRPSGATARPQPAPRCASAHSRRWKKQAFGTWNLTISSRPTSRPCRASVHSSPSPGRWARGPAARRGPADGVQHATAGRAGVAATLWCQPLPGGRSASGRRADCRPGNSRKPNAPDPRNQPPPSWPERR